MPSFSSSLLALIFGLVTLSALVNGKSVSGDRVLVIYDDASIRHSHSLFFGDLKGMFVELKLPFPFIN